MQNIIRGIVSDQNNYTTHENMNSAIIIAEFMWEDDTYVSHNLATDI